MGKRAEKNYYKMENIIRAWNKQIDILNWSLMKKIIIIILLYEAFFGKADPLNTVCFMEFIFHIFLISYVCICMFTLKHCAMSSPHNNQSIMKWIHYLINSPKFNAPAKSSHTYMILEPHSLIQFYKMNVLMAGNAANNRYIYLAGYSHFCFCLRIELKHGSKFDS